MKAAVRASRACIVKHSKSFSLASRVLPRAVAEGVWVIYAWCRRADDAIDLAPVEEQPMALARLREELADLRAGGLPEDPVVRAFGEVVAAHGISLDHADALLDGMEMDVRARRYGSLSELEHYGHLVAGVVGLLCCPVLGVDDERALQHADDLGIAMQLTNICRDVLEDWERDRLYLPQDLLEEEGAGALVDALGGPFPEHLAPAVSRVVARVLERADALYASGDAGLWAMAWRPAFAVRTARLVYAHIGERLRARDCDVLSGRVWVPGPVKLGLVLRAACTVQAHRSRALRQARWSLR